MDAATVWYVLVAIGGFLIALFLLIGFGLVAWVLIVERAVGQYESLRKTLLELMR